MTWEIMAYAFDKGLSFDEALVELAAEVVAAFEESLRK